jgi:HEAT repeat protein
MAASGGDIAPKGDAQGNQASQAQARGQAPRPGEPGRAEYIAAQRHARSAARDARSAASGGSPLSLEESRALLATPTASSEERVEAVDQLLDQGLEGEPDAPAVANILDSLREAALDPNPEVAIAATEALGEIETPASTQALGDILASNAPESVKLAAIDAITSLDTAGAAVALSRGLRDASPDVRDEAAWGMSWVDDRDQSALSALVQAANVETDELIFDTMVGAIEDYE